MDAFARFQQKFHKAELYIERLKVKISIQQGTWVFRRHVYSVKELLQSPEHSKIYAICEKIGDDVCRWRSRGQLSDEELAEYIKQRARMGRRLRTVNRIIENRKPTKWEKILYVFTEFNKLVLSVLPTLGRLLQMGLGKLLGYAGRPKELPLLEDA